MWPLTTSFLSFKLIAGDTTRFQWRLAQYWPNTLARLWLDVYQINKVDHTDAGAQDRLHNQPIFGGSAPDGKCLICDDVVTYGATKLAPKRTLIVKLERRYGQELERCTETLGFGSECLTAREAYFLAGMRTVERIRDCLTQRIGSTNRSRSIKV